MRKKLGLLLMCLLALVGCSTNSSTTVISAGSIVENQQMQDEQRKAEIILTEKERFEKDYGTGGYLNDNSEIQARLNKEAYNYYKAYFEVNAQDVEYFLVNIDLFHSAYEIVEEENLSYKDIAESHLDLIDQVEITVFSFANKDNLVTEEQRDKINVDNIRAVYDLIEDGKLNKEQLYLAGYVYDERLENVFISKYSSMSSKLSLIHYMNLENENKYNYTLIENFGIRSLYRSENDHDMSFSEILVYLNESYNEEFMFVNTKSYKNYFSSLRRPDLAFEALNYKDRYIAVLVQDYISSNVNRVLKEMNVEDKFGVFTASVGGPKDGIDMAIYHDSIDKIAADCQNFMALYYVIGEDETFDYQLLKDVVVGVQNYILTDQLDGDTMYIKLFRAKKSDALTFLKLLRDNPVTENYIRDGGLGSDWEISFNETESFRFLDCFGTQEDFLFKFHTKLDHNDDVDNFFKGTKMKNEYERLED